MEHSTERQRDEFNVHLYDSVYNINKFMQNHPGGTSLLYNMKDKDIARQMVKFGHNEFAYHLLEEYKVRRSTSNGVKQNGVENGKNGHHKNGHNKVNVNNNNVSETDVDLDAYADKVLHRLKEIDQIEALVDWSKPMMDQLENLGPHYNDWLECPVDKNVRLFKSSFMESFTYTPWYGVLIYWIPIAIYLVNYTYKENVDCGDQCRLEPLSNSAFLINLIIGALAWTIIEYIMHRFVFHCQPKNSIKLMKFHFIVHGMHHKTPFDRNRQVFPPVAGSVVAIILHFLFVYPWFPRPLLSTTGVILGYLVYDMVHFYLHHGKPKDGTFLYTMKRYHANHHFTNPDIGYGITTLVWDDIFNTKINLKKLGFSLSWK